MMKQKEKEGEEEIQIRQWGEMRLLHFGSISDEMVKTHEIPKKYSIPMFLSLVHVFSPCSRESVSP